MRSFKVLLALALFTTISFGQSRNYYPDNSIKVFTGSIEQNLAWCGGFNNPQFTMGDINNDGKQDLVVYESFKGVKTFINSGIAGTPVYTYAPEYALNFPPVYNYLVLADINCDNVPDLIHEGSSGYSIYKGYYNSLNRLCFSYLKDLYYYNDVHLPGGVNAFNNPQDIPAIVDVDNDGDLDFISYDILGGYLNWYRNMKAEHSLPCDSLEIYLWDRCWGKSYQGFYRTHMLERSCDNSGLHRSSDTAARTTHSGNTPCLFDWDMDGDYDYLDGSVSFNEMTFMKNGRIEYSSVDSMVAQDTTWQTGGHTISLPTWPAAFNIDIDQDGKKDLLIAPNATNASENYKCVWFYRNQTTPGSPNWQFMSDTCLIDKTVDAGTAAYPAFFDYDRDGKPDMFVGSDGYMQSSGLLRSRISYYHNTSTTGTPSFTLVTKDFLQMDTFAFQGAAPTFGDIDRDGLVDMLVGHTNGTITYYKNTASLPSAQPIWIPQQITLRDSAGTVINVGGKATPFVYDVDKDLKKDLVIGNMYGTLQYYRNVSTFPGNISLKLINQKLGNIKADPNQLFNCNSVPFIGRVDSTGRDYLLLGSNSGNIYRFDSIASGDTTLTYPMLDSQFAFVDSTYLLYNHPGSQFGVYGNLRSAPAIADVDGDGDYEMVVGTVLGGLNLYKRKIDPFLSVQDPAPVGLLNIYPNPASNSITINWSASDRGNLTITITDLSGRTYATINCNATQGHATTDISALANGMYIVNMIGADTRYYGKLTIVR